MGDYILTKDGKLYHCDTSREAEELMHHGIKGMKWGIRRYQNKSGSLTAAGRVRYGASKVGEVAKKVGDKAVSSIKKKREEKRIEKLRKKPLSKLSDAELKERIARMTEEKRAFDLQKQMSSIDQDQAVTGKRFINGAINKVIAPAMVDAGKQVLTSWLKKQGMDLAGLGESTDAFSVLKKEAEAINKQRQMSDDKRKIRENDLWIKKQDQKESEEASKTSTKKESNDSSNKTANKPKQETKKPVEVTGEEKGTSKNKYGFDKVFSKKSNPMTLDVKGDSMLTSKGESYVNKESNLYKIIESPVSGIKGSDQYDLGESFVEEFFYGRKR